jgi:hypothetical protein
MLRLRASVAGAAKAGDRRRHHLAATAGVEERSKTIREHGVSFVSWTRAFLKYDLYLVEV